MGQKAWGSKCTPKSVPQIPGSCCPLSSPPPQEGRREKEPQSWVRCGCGYHGDPDKNRWRRLAVWGLGRRGGPPGCLSGSHQTPCYLQLLPQAREGCPFAQLVAGGMPGEKVSWPCSLGTTEHKCTRHMLQSFPLSQRLAWVMDAHFQRTVPRLLSVASNLGFSSTGAPKAGRAGPIHMSPHLCQSGHF